MNKAVAEYMVEMAMGIYKLNRGKIALL